MIEKKRPLFSILHTSARPDQWRKIYDAWIGAADRPEDVEYVLCVDERWGFGPRDKFGECGLSQAREEVDKVVWNEGRRCYVDGVNTAATASTGQILVVNADDQWPMQGWDSALWQVYRSSDPTPRIKRSEHRSAYDPTCEEFVIEVSTGTPDEHKRGIIVMPVVSRSQYERLGYVFYPDYESMFADNDLHDHAAQDGVIIQAHGLMFPHKHPLFDDQGVWRKPTTQEWDPAYQEQNRQEAYRIGEVLLKWRRRIRFGTAIEEAKQIQGWMTEEELLFLSRAASQMDTVVEIGSWMGRSTYSICSGTAGNVYAVDHWNWKLVSESEQGKQYTQTPPEDQPLDVYNEFVSHVVDRFPNVLAVRKSGLEAAKTLPDADMVFIDDSHVYEETKANLLAWLPKTKKLICGHDYSRDPGHQGVVRAVNEAFGARVQVKPGTTIWYIDLTGPSASAGSAIVPNGKVIAWCIPGENFTAVMLQSILKLYAYLLVKGYYVVTHHMWTSSPYVTREALRLSVQAMPVKPLYVLWTDDDNPVTPEIFERLLKDLESSEEVSSVAGWTWVDMYDGGFAVSAGIFNEDKANVRMIPPAQISKETSLIEVEWHGFPVVLMKYATLVSAGDKPFAGIPAPESRWGIAGEDTSFCTNLKARSNCRLFVDPLAFVPHLKSGAIGPDGKQKEGASVEELAKI